MQFDNIGARPLSLDLFPCYKTTSDFAYSYHIVRTRVG